MTAIEPRNTANPGLVSRQAATPTHVAPAQRPLSELEAQAKMIAAVPTEMLPKLYQRNPGACMLAIDWAGRNGVSILEAIGEVSFVHGRPVVSARLQKKLASRAGYRTQKISGDETQCTVAVIDPQGEKVGEATYTIEQAQALGIAKGQIWQADPAQMLFHRATTRALDHYGPADLAGMFADPYEAPDPVDAVEAPVGAMVNPHPQSFTEAQDTPTDTLGDTQWDPKGAEADIRALAKAHGKKVGDIIRHCQDLWPDDAIALISDIAQSPDKTAVIKDWIQE